MVTYSQRDPRWAGHPYSARPPHTETVQSSGCGPTTAAMIVSSLTEQTVTPAQMADYSVKHGCRIDGVGTALALFPAVAKEYGLTCRASYSINQAVRCVRAGGLAACSTNGGQRGLFSTGGHLFLLCGANGDVLEFADPDLYTGKYAVPWRKNRATVQNGRVYVQKAHAGPEITVYYLFEKGIHMEQLNQLQSQVQQLTQAVNRLSHPMVYNYIDGNMPAWARPYVQKAVDLGWVKGDGSGLNLTDDKIWTLTVLLRAMKVME